MVLKFVLLVSLLTVVKAVPAKDSYKDQYCTDPRTMAKHAAYQEWADAYSCTRHRCQPGGRNLAIYTVGCKRVEAPESAIECEEVVEDTNMQFPYCCTRLRCLVVVRGEVWTRVLGQPWETLPAAPWSHMYKMKKPPPADGVFGAKKSPSNIEGPIYELLAPDAAEQRDTVLRTVKKTTTTTEAPECADPPCNAPPKSSNHPDIVIALNTDTKERKEEKRKKDHKNRSSMASYFEPADDLTERELDEDISATEKSSRVPFRSNPPPLEGSEETKIFANSYGVTKRVPTASRSKNPQNSWSDIPQNQWNGEPSMEPQLSLHKGQPAFHASSPDHSIEVDKADLEGPEENKEPKRSNLQALVDAIGSRMRDIENVVLRMSEKVHQKKPTPEYGSEEKGSPVENDIPPQIKQNIEPAENQKRPSPQADHYKRFTVRSRGSKYIRGSVDTITEPPLYIEDTRGNGYFSDASNSVLRRNNHPKEPSQPTYMAPVENRRKAPAIDSSDDADKKKHKHSHKKHAKGHVHKKHHKDEKHKRFNRLNSVESDRNIMSLEDTSGSLL